MNLILGLNAFHPDSAACVLKDGKLVAGVAVERLGHCPKYMPRLALAPKRCSMMRHENHR